MARKKISRKRQILKPKRVLKRLVLRDTADRKVQESYYSAFPSLFEDIPQLPLDYLLHASDKSLNSFYLDRMSRAGVLEKELRVVLEQAVENLAQAQMAQWVRKCRTARVIPNLRQLPLARRA